MFLDLDRMGPARLDRIAEPMERPHAGIPAPRKHQSGGTTGADNLVVDEVRGPAAQRQIPALLADDLVARSEGDEVGDPLEGEGLAVLDRLRHGIR